MMRPFACTAVLALAACVPAVDLDRKACDAAHPCVEGYVCHASVCLTSSEIDALDAGTADAGPVDAGPVDSGLPASTATLSGTFQFAVGMVWDNSETVGDFGKNVTVDVAESTVDCHNGFGPGWHLEIDAFSAGGALFPPGTYAAGPNDGGPLCHVSLTHQLDDGGIDRVFGSDIAEQDGGPSVGRIDGHVTFLQFASQDVSGNFDLGIVGPDGGPLSVLGTFVANSQTCQQP